jgi:ribosomal protein S12 methylthiotransferase
LSYIVSFISLGCAKNQVNCEQMMALCQNAGHDVTTFPEGADVAVVNTCGFLSGACEEAIEHVLELGALKLQGKVKKIVITGCMAQRYKQDVAAELPEVDAVLGTGSYGDIVTAVETVMKGEKMCAFGNIHTAPRAASGFCPPRRGMPICGSPRAAAQTSAAACWKSAPVSAH